MDITLWPYDHGWHHGPQVFCCIIWSMHTSHDLCIHRMIYAYIAWSMHTSHDLCIHRMIYAYTAWSMVHNLLYITWSIHTSSDLWIHRVIYDTSTFHWVFLQTAPHIKMSIDKLSDLDRSNSSDVLYKRRARIVCACGRKPSAAEQTFAHHTEHSHAVVLYKVLYMAWHHSYRKGVALRMAVKEGSFLVILTTLVLPVYFKDWTAVAEAGKCTRAVWHVPKSKLRQLASYGNAACWTCWPRLDSAAISTTYICGDIIIMFRQHIN